MRGRRMMMAAAGLVPASSGNGPDGTNYYVEITIASSQVASDLTNFPVYVDLSTLPADFFTNVRSDGGDIRVTEATGATRMPREVAAIDTGAQTGELHFRADALSASSDTTFRIYYGNASATEPTAGATYGRNAVWASEYVFASHDAGITDSTGNGYDGANSGTTEVSGKLGVARDFDLDMVRVDAITVATSTHKVFSFLCNPDSIDPNGANDRSYLLDIDNSQNRRVFSMGNSGGTPNTPAFFDGSSWRDFDTAELLSSGSWSWIHYVHDETNDTVECYLNGASIGSIAVSADLAMEDSGSGQTIGRRATSSETDLDDWVGLIDEVRLRAPSTLSNISAWIAAEYTNQDTPGTFYSVGIQQAA